MEELQLPSLTAFLAGNIDQCSVSEHIDRGNSPNCSACSQPLCDWMTIYRRVDGTHTCTESSRCESAVRIIKPDCGHVIGAKCLVELIGKGKNCCPFCEAKWFRPVSFGMRKVILSESQLWNWTWGWDLGRFTRGNQ